MAIPSFKGDTQLLINDSHHGCSLLSKECLVASKNDQMLLSQL